MRIDAHTHLGLGKGEQRAEGLLVMLEAYGIDRAVAFPAVSGLAGSPRAIALANDYLAEAMSQHAGRIVGFATVNPYHEEEAWREVERAAKMGLRGLKLHPPLQGFVLSDRTLLDPLFERAARLMLPVVIHAGLRVAGLPYVLVNLADAKVLANAHSRVTFIVAHMGWGGRDSHGVADLARDCPNVWFDTAGVNMPGLIRQVADLGAAQRILYGSDFPFLHPRVELLRVELAELPADVASGVMGGNAQRLLGL
ncbi:MAG: amidohydrolase family protein [bacterium]